MLTVSTTTSNVLSALIPIFAVIILSTFSAETRRKNCRYLPRNVYTLAGPVVVIVNGCYMQDKDERTINSRWTRLQFLALFSVKSMIVKMGTNELTMSLASAQNPSCGSSAIFTGMVTSASWRSIFPLRISWIRTVIMRLWNPGRLAGESVPASIRKVNTFGEFNKDIHTIVCSFRISATVLVCSLYCNRITIMSRGLDDLSCLQRFCHDSRGRLASVS